jgi:ribosome recycling factor
MQKTVANVADNFNTMRTGRANPAILDRIQVGGASLRCGPLAQQAPAKHSRLR